MSEILTIQAPVTGPERPVVVPDPASEPAAPTEKALKDTKAELTRVQQELAALKKGAAVTPDPAPTDPQPDARPAEGLTIPDVKPDDGAPSPDDKSADEQVVPGVDNAAFAPWQEEYTKTGDVAPESRGKIVDLLASKGFAPELAKQLVDDYVESAKVRDQAAQDRAINEAKTIMNSVGGESAYNAMVQWAARNFTPEERAAYDTAITGGGAAASLAVAGLQSKYRAANKGNPTVVQATAPSITSSDVYTSMYEVSKDMANPEYKKDPDFRAKVRAKLDRSQL
jgi:hypothetical protein